MTSDWQQQHHHIKFQLGDKTLFSISLFLLAREIGLGEGHGEPSQWPPPIKQLPAGCEGYLIRAMPVDEALPQCSRVRGYLRYVPRQYRHHYIDLGMSFADYGKKFSSKTRSTINRKVRKFAEHCGGALNWKVYRHPDQVMDFYRLARQVSGKTYQEKLLDAGLPEGDAFVQSMMTLAEADQMRGYILFDNEEPIAYLYCPVHDGVLIYAYLGYDPAYREWSVGTVLQWQALEDLFNECRFRYFDFTEGESDHKRLFATDNIQCANVYFLRPGLRNRLLVRGQQGMDKLSSGIGNVLERYGLKARIKQLIRFGRS